MPRMPCGRPIWQHHCDPGCSLTNVRAVLAHLELEHDNMRAALRWAEAANDLNLALQLLRELGTFWIFRGHYREGRWWLDRWLQAHSTGQPGCASVATGPQRLAHHPSW